MLPAHGGRLVNRQVEDDTAADYGRQVEAGEIPTLSVDADRAAVVDSIGTGVYSPLEGFMNRAQLDHVLHHSRLPDDVPWTLPVLLDVSAAQLERLRRAAAWDDGRGGPVALVHGETLLAVVDVQEITAVDADLRRRLAESVYGTTSQEHPGVRRVQALGGRMLAGPLHLVNRLPTPYEGVRLTPAETRVLFREKDWRTIVGFQTRNCPHLGHEYVQKTALTFVDGIFINPVLGKKKAGDFRDPVILSAYRALLDNYYLRRHAVLSILGYEMQYAGPKEAVHHAIMRKNFGCTHFVVGRDHAGVGDFYGRYEAQAYFDEFPDLGIVPLPFRSFFYCRVCGTVVNSKTCPHGDDVRDTFSGTRIRRLLREPAGDGDLDGLMRPEVVRAIRDFDEPFVG